MVNYDKFDRIVEDDEKEEVTRHIDDTEAFVQRFKEEGNKGYREGRLTDAVGYYTSCIVLLTGCRDPRVRKTDVMREVSKNPDAVKESEEERNRREQEEQRKQKMSDMQADMPKGVTAIDPTEQQQQQPEEAMDPVAEMGKSHETGYVDDAEVEARSMRAMMLLQQSPKLRELLSLIFSNRATCAVKISEGKEEAFKQKITTSPGGIEKWDGYRVRMTVDSLNDCKQAVQLDPNNQKAWYRVGYSTHRLIKLIDRIRERKAWLREEELPILDKPSMWEEARESLCKSLDLLKKDDGSHSEIKAVHDKLVDIYEGYSKMTCSIRKLGHENLGISVNDKTLVMEGVDEKGPAEKWGGSHFIGCKLTHMKVGDEGAMLPISDVPTLAKRQTHASYVTVAFAPSKPLPPLPSLSLYLPAGSECLKEERFVAEEAVAVAAQTKVLADPEKRAPTDPTALLPRDASGRIIYSAKDPKNSEKWGPPQPRKFLPRQKGGQLSSNPQVLVAILSLFVVLVAMLLYV